MQVQTNENDHLKNCKYQMISYHIKCQIWSDHLIQQAADSFKIILENIFQLTVLAYR